MSMLNCYILAFFSLLRLSVNDCSDNTEQVNVTAAFQIHLILAECPLTKSILSIDRFNTT